MSVVAALHHVTRYRYDRPVTLGPHVVRLRPAPHCRTRIPSYSLKVTPSEHFINWQQDPHGNWLARLVFPERTTELSVTVDLTAEMSVINPFDFFIEPYAETLPFSYSEDLRGDLAAYMNVDDGGLLLEAAVAALEPAGKRTIDFLVGLNEGIQRTVTHVIRMEAGVQTPDQTLSLGSGSCRDSAWLLVQMMRGLGFAARFVSGYLIQLKADIDPTEGPLGTRTDFTDLHAWAEVYIPGAGWIGFDATSGLLCGEGHLPLAASPHYRSSAAIAGGVSKAECAFEFEMDVSRLVDTIRITRPFDDAGWDALDRLGERVEADLQAQDVRLTMGGEPTFVSVDDFEAAEWQTDASGPTKPVIAAKLLDRLRSRFGPGGMLHYGQGKWYPGEPLPRWALGLYWRRDGQPVWRGAVDSTTQKKKPATASDALALIRRLAVRLGVDPKQALPAREDPLHWIKTEGDLPKGVKLNDTAIDYASSRNALRRAMAGGLSKPLGYVLPLRRAVGRAEGKGWLSEAWRFKRGQLYLVPGDSPVGLRLPLGSLPPLKPKDYPYIVPVDPYEERGKLPSFDAIYRAPSSAAKQASGASRAKKPATKLRAKKPAVRTAIAIEARDGVLCVFMPPLARVEDYLELVAQLEVAAEGMPLRIEGYTPPDDIRLSYLKVTPDPGVIEVNVQPAENWREAVAITTGVYDDAASCRLGADKFMIDGRHTGTGGGAHVVVGGIGPGQLALPAPAGPSEKLAALLAAPSGAVLPVFRSVRWPDQPGPASR